jgi:tetratricopeptide (TPR) repeat protein
MVWPVYEAVFRDLRKLADWFSTSCDRRRADPAQLARLVNRLGATAIPLLGRELRSTEPERREAARDALAAVAARGARARVTAELHAITAGAVADEAKVVALGLLSELGEHAEARFADPAAIRARAAIALAAQLETAADLAGAADLMVHQLDADDIVQMLEAMADAAPVAAHRLASELTLRLDVGGEVRDRIALVITAIASRLAPEPTPSPGAPAAAGAAGAAGRPAAATLAVVLVDAAARLVVIASRKIAGERRWRRWAVLIGASGRIDDCLHEDDAGGDGDASSLTGRLCAEGYRVASTDPVRAREVVAVAARRTAELTHALPSHYYLGRDLLDLADAHWSRDILGERHGDPASAALSRAIELVAAGQHARALPLLERCDPDHPDAAAALAAVFIAQDRPAAALVALDRALAAEPDWPLHHWNLAAALHKLGDTRGCYHALRRFVATSAAPSGLCADPDQPARVGCAERMIAELERTARLTGSSLGGRPLRRRGRAARKRRTL